MASRPESKLMNKPQNIHRSTSSHVTELSSVKKLILKRAPVHTRSKRDVRQEIIELGNMIRAAETAVEAQERKAFKQTDHRVAFRLGIDDCQLPPRAEFLPTPKSMPMQAAYRSMFRGQIFDFDLATALNMSSSAGGAVNSTIAISVVQSIGDYSAFSAIFEEFFVTHCDVHWQPNSRYNFPLGGLPDGKTISALPIGCANLQHQEAAYSSNSAAANNYLYKWSNTADPFSYTWRNAESPSSTVDTLTSTTQGWCSTTSGQTYVGSLQFISQSPPPGIVVSSVLGTFFVNFRCKFRVRA